MEDSKLRQARKERGWTMTQAAEELCLLCEAMSGKTMNPIDYTVIGRWERGKITPSPYYQEKLCLLYNMTPGELGFEENDVNRRNALKVLGASAMLTLVPDLLRTQYGAYEETLHVAWNVYYTGAIDTITPLLVPWTAYLRERSSVAAGAEKQQVQALLCRYLQLSGVVAREQNRTTDAALFAEESVLLGNHLKSADLVTTASIRRARLFVELEKADAAVLSLEAAGCAAKKSQDPARCYLMMYLAQTYAQNPKNHHQRQKAFRLLDDVESTLRSKGELSGDGSFMKVDTNGFQMLRSEVFRRYGEYDEAEQSLSLIDNKLGTRWQGNLLVAKAELAQARKQPDAVQECAKKALQVAEQTGSTTMKKKALALL